jgi:ABC-2 type transport system permease protein
MTQGMGVDAGALENLGVAAADTASVAAPAGGEMGVVVTTLANIPWGTLIVSFFLFFIFGYLLYASLFAAIGSAVENEADTQQLQIPLTIPLMVAYMIVFVAFRNPDGRIVLVAANPEKQPHDLVVKCGGREQSLSLPACSFNTLVF